MAQIAGSVASHAILLVLVLFALAPLLEALSTSFKTKREINTGNTLIPKIQRRLSSSTCWADRRLTGCATRCKSPSQRPSSRLLSGASAATQCRVGASVAWTLYGNTLLMVQMFPGVMLGIPLFLVLDNYGLIDTMWALCHLSHLRFGLLGVDVEGLF